MIFISSNRAEKEISQITEVLSTLESLATIPVVEIDANRYVRPVMATLKEKLAPWTQDVFFYY